MIKRIVDVISPDLRYTGRFAEVHQLGNNENISPAGHAEHLASVSNEVNNIGQDDLRFDIGIPLGGIDPYHKALARALIDRNITPVGYRLMNESDLELAREFGIKELFPLSSNLRLIQRARAEGFKVDLPVGTKFDLDIILGMKRAWAPPFKKEPIPYLLPGDSVTIVPVLYLPDLEELRKSRLVREIMTKRGVDDVTGRSEMISQLMEQSLSNVQGLYEKEVGEKATPRLGRAGADDARMSLEIAFFSFLQEFYGDLVREKKCELSLDESNESSKIRTIRSFEDDLPFVRENTTIQCSPSDPITFGTVESIVSTVKRKLKPPDMKWIMKVLRQHILQSKVFKSKVGVFGSFDVETIKQLPKDIDFLLTPISLADDDGSPRNPRELARNLLRAVGSNKI